MAQTYRNLIEPLVKYTAETFNEISPQMMENARLIYDVIREAIVDLHGDNKELRKDAEQYFNSPLFESDCAYVRITPELMLYIARNPNKYKQHMVYGDEVGCNESNSEF